MIKKHLCIFGFTIFGLVNLFAQVDSKADSLLAQLEEKSLPDTVRIEVFLQLADHYKNTDPSKGESYLVEGILLAKDKQLPFWQAKLQTSLIQLLSLTDREEESILVGLAALRTFDSLGRKDQSLITQSILIPIFSSRGYYDKALELSLSSLRQIEDDPDTPSKGRYYFNVGNTYRSLEQYDSALYYYEGALQISERTNFRPGIAVISLNIASCKIELGSFSEARELLERELEYFKLTENKSLTASTYGYLGDLAAKEGRSDLAARNYELANEIFKKLGFGSNVQELSNKLYIHYSILGKSDLASKAEDSYKLLRDSLQKEEITVIVGELQTRYETEKKESEIAALKQDTEIQNLQIRQRNLLIAFGLIASVLIIVLIMFFNRQRSAAKRRKQIELEQRFLRSQLNPHFISNALVSVQSSLMDGDVRAAETYLSTFSRLMREILEFSREEYIIIEDEVRMLTDYIEINQQRLKGQLEYSISVSEEVEQEFDKIPPMIIQPFIENAIEHGVPPEGKKLSIKLDFRSIKDIIQVVIEDNGGGILEGTKGDRRSFSTQIIKERIALLNESLKQEIRLQIENWKNEAGTDGLRVTLSLPVF